MKNIVQSLKNLGAKLLGVDVKTISGQEKCDVIDYIAENYKAPQGMSGTATAIEAIGTPESAGAADIANKVNEIITQLKARGVIS